MGFWWSKERRKNSSWDGECLFPNYATLQRNFLRVEKSSIQILKPSFTIVFIYRQTEQKSDQILILQRFWLPLSPIKLLTSLPNNFSSVSIESGHLVFAPGSDIPMPHLLNGCSSPLHPSSHETRLWQEEASCWMRMDHVPQNLPRYCFPSFLHLLDDSGHLS